MKKLFVIAFLTFLTASCKKPSVHISKIIGKQLHIKDSLTTDSLYVNFIAPYKKKLSKKINKVLSYTPINLVRTDGYLESTLGNLYADLSYTQTNAIFKKKWKHSIDFVLFNYGGIRAGISKGNITVNNAFELMPFENKYVVVELSGKKVQELINYLVTKKIAHPISHINITLKNGELNKVTIQKKLFDINKNYYVLTSDYLQHGGDKMNFFKNPINLYNLNYKIRKGLIDYLSKKDTLKAKLDGRFKDLKI